MVAAASQTADRRTTYIEDGNFVNSFALGIRLSGKIFVDVLEVRDGDILFKFFVKDNIVIDKLNLASEIL